MNKRFFHFPLCLLSTVEDVRRGVNDIILFACVDIGKKRWETFSADERQALRSVLPSASVCQCSIDPTSDEQLQAVAGCEYLRITVLNIKGILAGHARLSRFVKEFEDRHGTDAQVRIRRDWFF